MEYNIHPIIVHFPIAFLILYSLIVILPVKRWFPNQSWKLTRLLMVGLGFLGVLAAFWSGEVAEDLTGGPDDVVDAHEDFANATAWFYGFLLAGEMIPLVAEKIVPHLRRADPFFTILNKILKNRSIVWILALAGLISLTLTGMLGGILVHGTSADPLAPILLKILGID